MDIINIFFYMSITLVFYTYAIYPLVVFLISKAASTRNVEEVLINELPAVKLIITGHNISHLIKMKMETLSKLEYGGDLSFLFVLDGCTDDTQSQIESYMRKDNRIGFFSTARRNGKESAIKEALKSVDTDVLVFSDSDAILNPDCVEKLIYKLLQKGVGAVSGREIHEKKSDLGASQGQGLFYKYEEFVKKHLASFNSLPYVQGGNFAMYSFLYPENIESGCTQDGIIAFNIVANGYKVDYQPLAVSSEEYNLSNKEDFRRRIRTINRAFYSIIRSKYIFNPLKTGSYGLHVMSSRVFRWFTLYFLSIAFLTGIFSESDVINNITIIGAFLGAFLILLGGVGEKVGKRYKLTYFSYYFFYIHFAAAIAVFKVFLGKKTTTWKPSN
jgi:cellulose synthase/poly-beta-1,6-N-acetylglucosamine synthase-like glycosyltransferase